MPFRLTKDPTCFPQTLDLILKRFKGSTCLVYLDNVIIISKAVEDRIRNVDENLTNLTDAGVTLNIN